MVTVADTAFSIAAVRAAEAELPDGSRLFDDPYAAIFRDAGAHAEEATQRYLSLPFFYEGIRLRTRFIDDVVNDALASELRQLVLLGAGFDARGLRLAAVAASGTRVFEIDTPAQLERKREILDNAGIAIPSSIVHVPVDFETTSLDDAVVHDLSTCGFRPGSGAIFVWEGVIGYIDDAAVDTSLRFMATAGGPATRAVFTYHDGRFNAETATDHVLRAGFTSCEELHFDALWRRYLPGDPHPNAHIAMIGVGRI